MTNDTQPTSKPRETTLGRKIIGVATGVDSLGASVRHNVAIPAKIGFDIADAFRQIFVRPDCSVESR